MRIKKALLAFVLFSLCGIMGFGQVNFPGGRIALSFDGNVHDDDDIVALPMSMALLWAAGLKNDVVHVEYSNHVCKHGTENDGKPQFQGDDAVHMRESAQGVIERFGYDASVFFDYTTKGTQATQNLIAAINASSADDKLWIIAAGPMETVWRGLNGAQTAKRQHVIVISHSRWNQNHGDCGSNSHTWSDMVKDFAGNGVLFVESCGYSSDSPCTQAELNNPKYLADQNISNGDNDFSTPESKWYWLRDSDNPDYRWLFSRNPFGNKFDPSDAGMAYFLISGGPWDGGCKTCGWREAKQLLENPIDGGNTGGNTGSIADISNLTATALTCNSVKLTWGDVSGEDAYRIRRKTTNGTYETIADVPANTITYTDNTAAGNTAYVYMVRPMQNGAAVKVSNEPSVTTASCGTSVCTTYTDKNGLIIMEAENTPSKLDKWIIKKDVASYTGSAHLEFTGNGVNGGPATSPLTYTFTVQEGGEYRLIIRARKRLEGQPHDKNNDGYVKVTGDFVAGNTSATTAMLKNNNKFFGGAENAWGWAEKLDINHVKHDAVYIFKAGETYTLTISGRSINWNIDRIVFFKTSMSLAQAKNTNSIAETLNCGTIVLPKDCAGVNGGNAFIDVCGECVGGTTGKTACVPQVISDINDLTATALTCNSVKLNWGDVEGEDAYRIRRKTPNGTYEILADVPANTITYTDNTAAGNTAYVYMVRPMQNGAAVKVSNEPSVTTSACSVIVNPDRPNPEIINGVATYWKDKNIGRKFSVPNEWDKIVINANVTITGSFYMPTRNHPIEIMGKDRKTSIIQGDGSRPTDDGIKGRSYSAIRADKSPDLYIHDLTITKPMKFHIHGGFGNVTVERCDIVAGSDTHTTDGIHGGSWKNHYEETVILMCTMMLSIL
jgi:hypothetical protein